VPALAAELRRDLAELQDALAGAFGEAGAPAPAREARTAVAEMGGLSEPLLLGERLAPAGAVEVPDAHLDRAPPPRQADARPEAR
jgi:hypothetical protein